MKERKEQVKERILILGAGVMQGPAITIAKEMGLEAVAVDGDAKAPGAALADRFECIDLKDKAGIEALARELKASPGGLSGVMTAGTDFSASVAWVAEKLGLPGIPYEAALDASDKERMRRRFKEAGVPSPAFTVASAGSKGLEALPFPFPVVVKPVDNMGGRGCRRVDSPGELLDAVASAVKFSRTGRAIVEEYMEGPEFSVDALVYNGEIILCGLADRHIFFPPYFIEMGHTMPTDLDPAAAKALLEVFCAGVKALGITLGAAKGDIKLTPKGPMIGEIAARLSGGYMSGWTYPYASGVKPIRGAIEIALGRRPEMTAPVRNWTCAERAFISLPGRIRSIHGLTAAKAAPGVRDLFLLVKEGSHVIFPENNVTKCGNILSAAPERALAISSAEEAARAVLLRLEAPDTGTEAFLSAKPGTGAFPPDAFATDVTALAALEALPEEDASCGEALERGQGVAIWSFPAFTRSGLRDWMGRTIEETLAAVRLLTSLPLPMAGEGDGAPLLAKNFWAAVIRGGYQGGAYFIDNARRKK